MKPALAPDQFGARFGLRGLSPREQTVPELLLRQAAELGANVRKGEKLFVDGELELGSFVGDDGAKRMAFKVVANTYRILDSKQRAAEEAPAETAAEPKQLAR